MIIHPNQLYNHLKRGIKSFYIVFGDEPYQKMETIDAIRLEISKQGYLEREVFEITNHFDWEHWLWHLKTPSLFSPKRLIE